jgi:hypothetical protein
MTHLLVKRIPTKKGECLIELLALGQEALILQEEQRQKRRKENVHVVFVKSLRKLERLQKETFLTEKLLLDILA